jgi:hypothetical protein
MICPHDHQECDNRGCRYGGCQGRPSGELIAHKDPRFGKKIAVRSQNGGTASAPAAGSASSFRVERRERITRLKGVFIPPDYSPPMSPQVRQAPS